MHSQWELILFKQCTLAFGTLDDYFFIIWKGSEFKKHENCQVSYLWLLFKFLVVFSVDINEHNFPLFCIIL